MATKAGFIAVNAFIVPISVVGQTGKDSIESAKLALIEKLRDSGESTFRKALAEKRLSEDEIEDLLFCALDEYAECAALSAQAQAREQALPEDIVLNGIGGGTS